MKYAYALLGIAELYSSFGWKEAARRAFEEAEDLIAVAYYAPGDSAAWLELELERQRIERHVYLPTVE